jgi:lambda family phage portal protein
MHAVVSKLADVDGYTEAEIIGSRAAANIMAFIEAGADYADQNEETGDFEVNLEPGTVERLQPGEKLHEFNPNRPNAQAEAFIRAMLREIAAGANVSYESLSRDHSQSNYSSSRLALLDDREHYRALQRWWIRAFRRPLHRMWMQQAVLAGALPVSRQAYATAPRQFTAAKFTTKGFGWIDPEKEVNSSSEAIKAGFTTLTQVISEYGNGSDIHDVAAERRRELDELEALDLQYTTSPAQYVQQEAPTPAAPPAAMPGAPSAEDDESDDEDEAATDAERGRVVTLRR